MSINEIIKMVYRYSRSACMNTFLDYRDIAHIVICNTWGKLSRNEIRHAKTYMYLAVFRTMLSMLKSEQRYISGYDFLNHPARSHKDRRDDINILYREANKKERLIIQKTLEGYNRFEIADTLNITKIGVTVSWFRLVHRIRSRYTHDVYGVQRNRDKLTYG